MTLENKPYDLEERTLIFSKDLITLLKKLPKNSINFRICDQVIRSGTSIGANFREANDNLGEKDFLMRIKISRKEAKETQYWLELILFSNNDFSKDINQLIDEAGELKRILSSIINKFGKTL